MHKHHIHIYTCIRIRNICVIYSIYSLLALARNLCGSEHGHGHGHEHGNVQWTCLSPLLFSSAEVCQCQMCLSAHSPRLCSARGQLENMNRRKCCKLCRQHFSLEAAAKKEEVSQLALAFILTGIFLGTLTHTHTPVHVCLTTLWYTYTYIHAVFISEWATPQLGKLAMAKREFF